MEDQLTKVRALFPAEVTAGFFALYSLLDEEGGADFRQWWLVLFILALAGSNYWLYKKIRPELSIRICIFTTIGFVIWALNIALDDFRTLSMESIGLDYNAGDILIFAAPALLILYTIISSAIDVATIEEREISNDTV